MIEIKVRSKADRVKGQGVGACYLEQVRLIKEYLPSEFHITVNEKGSGDIYHYHTINPGYFMEAKMLGKKAVKVGYVHFLPSTLEDSIELPRLVQKLFCKYVMAFYNQMDYLVVVNPTFQDALIKSGITQPRIVYIPNYVSEEDFHNVSISDIAKTREKYKIRLKDFVVLGVGQVQTRKGILDFIKTAKKLPDIQFVWAGGFSFGNITAGYQQLKKIVESPPENVTFTGIIDRSRMCEIYNMADVFFLPSYEELFPMSVLEAMSCKIPILLRDSKEYISILKNYYLKGNTVEDFVDILKQLRGDWCMREIWTRQALACSHLYCKEYVGNMWIKFYQSLAEEKRKTYNASEN